MKIVSIPEIGNIVTVRSEKWFEENGYIKIGEKLIQIDIPNSKILHTYRPTILYHCGEKVIVSQVRLISDLSGNFEIHIASENIDINLLYPIEAFDNISDIREDLNGYCETQCIHECCEICNLYKYKNK